MSSLPPEILNEIFIRLPLKQRVKCLTVCRSWCRTLSNYSLFYSVELNSRNADQFQRLMTKFENSSYHASQVEVLIIYIQPGFVFNKIRLITLFPKARVIYLSMYYSTLAESNYDYTRKYLCLTDSNSKVEYLADVADCELAIELVTSNLCERLERLSLDSIHNNHPVFNHLKFLPVLTTLNLSRLTLSKNILEIIHRNLPNIQYFTISHIYIAPNDYSDDDSDDYSDDDDSLSSNIIPTTALKNLDVRIGLAEDLQCHIGFYRYLTKKYVNVSDIDLYDDSLWIKDDYYKGDLYSRGILEFYKLGGLFKDGKFDIWELPDGVDPFEIFDAVNKQIREVEFGGCDLNAQFENISRSNQVHSIQKLVLDSINIEQARYLENMATLKTLEICFDLDDRIDDDDPVDANLFDLINTFPHSLTDLKINIADTTTSRSVPETNHIQHLDIICPGLTQDLADKITSRFLNLISFTLRPRRFSSSAQFLLQQPLLNEATFCIKRAVGEKFGVAFKLSNQTETQYYLCDLTNKTNEVISYGDIKDLPMLSVVSSTNKKLEFIHSELNITIKVIND